MMDIGFGAAFLAGLLSFFSPCVLPIVPPYLAYLAGVSFSQLSSDDTPEGTAGRVFLAALLFVLGFSAVFIAFGATASAIGQTISRYFDILSIFAGLLILVMGLHFLGIFRIGLLYREARASVGNVGGSLAGAFVMGLAFAFGWTPCVGPVLAAILFVAGAEDTVWRGAMMLAVYSLGVGVPFLVAAAFAGPFLRWSQKFRKHLGTVERVMGGLLVITGILFMTGSMSLIAQWLIETFPAFATIG